MTCEERKPACTSEDTLKKALSGQPFNWEANAAMLDLLWEQGRHTEATAFLDSLKQRMQSQDTLSFKMIEAVNFEWLQRVEDAIENYRDAATSGKLHVQATCALVDATLEKHKEGKLPKQTIEHLQTCIDDVKNESQYAESIPALYILQDWILVASHRLKALLSPSAASLNESIEVVKVLAEKQLSAAILLSQIAPTLPNKLTIQTGQQRCSFSKKAVEKASLIKAEIHLNKKEPDAALALLYSCVKKNQSCAKAHELLGLSLTDQTEAIQHLEAAWNLPGASPEVGHHLARAFLRNNEPLAAVDCCNMVLELYPSNNVCKELLNKAYKLVRT
eukprot:Platyproteum_vivax@DN6580_c0_g1_i2.p1